jgi:hypothetical protein
VVTGVQCSEEAKAVHQWQEEQQQEEECWCIIMLHCLLAAMIVKCIFEKCGIHSSRVNCDSATGSAGAHAVVLVIFLMKK